MKIKVAAGERVVIEITTDEGKVIPYEITKGDSITIHLNTTTSIGALIQKTPKT